MQTTHRFASWRPRLRHWYERHTDSVWYALFFLGILVLGLLIAMVSAFFEAEAFTRVTGTPVTTWDAMWLSLRVDCR